MTHQESYQFIREQTEGMNNLKYHFKEFAIDHYLSAMRKAK